MDRFVRPEKTLEWSRVKAPDPGRVLTPSEVYQKVLQRNMSSWGPRLVPWQDLKPFEHGLKPGLSISLQIMDDYYSHPVAWSARGHLLVLQGRSIQVFLKAGQVLLSVGSIFTGPPGHCLAFDPSGSKCLIGFSYSEGARILNTRSYESVGTLVPRDLNPYRCMDFESDQVFYSGHEKGLLACQDLRIPNPLVWSFQGHLDKVCNVKNAPKGFLLASGCNGNRLLLTDKRKPDMGLFETQFKSAVKAMAWKPGSASLLACGSGNSDQTVRVFDAGSFLFKEPLFGFPSSESQLENKALYQDVSQICSLIWHEDLILTGKGYYQKNMTLLRASDLQELGSVQPFGMDPDPTQRILHLALNKQGTFLVALSSKKMICFPDPFNKPT